VYYCSKACQKSDWKAHKASCARVSDEHSNSTAYMQDEPTDVPNVSPDVTLSNVMLWEDMGRKTIERSNVIGGHWPVCTSEEQLATQAAIFAGHFIASDCVPYLNVCNAGVIISGARRTPKFDPVHRIGGGIPDWNVQVYIKYYPNAGEIWLLVHRDGLPRMQLCTDTFLSSWVESGMMPGPVPNRVHCTFLPVDETYFEQDTTSQRYTDFGIRMSTDRSGDRGGK
jgi:hypothetical protein